MSKREVGPFWGGQARPAVRLEDLTVGPGDTVECDSEFTIDEEKGAVHQRVSNVRVTRADNGAARELCDESPTSEASYTSYARVSHHETWPPAAPPRLSLAARLNRLLDRAWRALGGGAS